MGERSRKEDLSPAGFAGGQGRDGDALEELAWGSIKFTALLLALIGADLAVHLTGCAVLDEATATERGKLRTAIDTYASTMRVLAVANERGRLTEEQIERVDRWYPIARGALDRWRELLNEGDDPATAADEFWRALAVLTEVMWQVKEGGEAG